MLCKIKSIHYSPVKSLSFSDMNICKIKKDVGILNDRIFSFSRNIDLKKAKLIEAFPKERKLNYFLTLKNTPVLNKYKFIFNNDELTLLDGNNIIMTINSSNYNDYSLICSKLIDLEKNLNEPIFLLKNRNYPFFDTSHSQNISNTISLVNINSINDFENRIKTKIEYQRFRANIYVDGIEPWAERKWINSIIKINKIQFRVVNHIGRCSATNLKPNSDNSTINLPLSLKNLYNHSDMGIYLKPLNSGEINIDDEVIINE